METPGQKNTAPVKGALHVNNHKQKKLSRNQSCRSDMAIASCMRVAAQRGYRIPRDIKMVAYDGTGMTQTGIQPITAVRQPIENLAAIAAQKVVSKLKGTKDNLPWVLQPRLLRGETC